MPDRASGCKKVCAVCGIELKRNNKSGYCKAHTEMRPDRKRRPPHYKRKIMKTIQLGQTKDGQPLYGNDGKYYLNGKLVAVKNSSENYFCLPDIWEQQHDTSWVSEEQLSRMGENEH
jgi:hypothetical protein